MFNHFLCKGLFPPNRVFFRESSLTMVCNFGHCLILPDYNGAVAEGWLLERQELHQAPQDRVVHHQAGD